MRKITTKIVIVIILWTYVISSMIYNPHFGIQFIFGIISLTFVSTALLLGKKDLSLGILTFALILSTFNAVKFSDAFEAHIGFVSLIPFILLLVLIFSNLSELMNLKEKWLAENDDEIESGKIRKTEFFKREFKNLSQTELNRKLTDEKLTDEAKNAIVELLELKK